MRILFIFIDGLGIGENEVIKNPSAQSEIQLFNNFLSDTYPQNLHFKGIVKPIECQLGIKGLPQSATGQTALYTGINAVQLLKKHLSGFPNQQLRDLLEQHSILNKITQHGRKAVFINAYRPIYFERGPEALIRFLSVTSIMNWKAGLKFFDFQDLDAERCIYHDFTNRELIRKGSQIPVFTPEKAGRILASESKNYDFCLYEYFKTDRAGHKQDMIKATDLLFELEEFLITVLKHTDLSKTLVIITSDHGNIEDLSVKSHTKNPVPFMAWGAGKDELVEKVESILDVTPSLLRLMMNHQVEK